MRGELAKHLDQDPHFRWRGKDVTRIENLSDIVFALALSMLLLTGTPPSSYGELIDFMLSFIPVAAGFAVLFLVWNAHFTFFRRYGLADAKIVFINSLLLLVVLFVTYPLRFIFDSFFGYVIGLATGDWQRLIDTDMGMANSAVSIAIFGGIYAVIALLTSIMYAHALSRAQVLDLSATEIALTKQSVWLYRGEILISLLVVMCALYTPLGPFAGVLMGFTALNGWGWSRVFNTKQTMPSQDVAVDA